MHFVLKHVGTHGSTTPPFLWAFFEGPLQLNPSIPPSHWFQSDMSMMFRPGEPTSETAQNSARSELADPGGPGFALVSPWFRPGPKRAVSPCRHGWSHNGFGCSTVPRLRIRKALEATGPMVGRMPWSKLGRNESICIWYWPNKVPINMILAPLTKANTLEKTLFSSDIQNIQTVHQLFGDLFQTSLPKEHIASSPNLLNHVQKWLSPRCPLCFPYCWLVLTMITVRLPSQLKRPGKWLKTSQASVLLSSIPEWESFLWLELWTPFFRPLEFW